MATGSLLAGLAGQQSVQPAEAQLPVQPASPIGSSERHWFVTLITGQRVLVTRDAAGSFDAAVVGPAGAGEVHTAAEGDHLYVVPLAVQSLVGPVLDPALFDVRELIAQGLDDAGADRVPVIVEQEGAESAARLEGSTDGALDARQVLPRTGLVTGAVIKGRAGELRSQFAARAGQRAATATGQGVSGITRMWLSRRVTATWDRNLEQIGAPAAWAGGGDGTGVKIAVLDTGIDATHPDFAGKVAASKDFTGKGNVIDGDGHGTHVAGLALGSGAGNAGERKGVAPGAALLVGKVLNDQGSGTEHQVIEGIEWAAASGADVVNLSLGSRATDGTDPKAVAINRLTKQGTLFVVSAGNSGTLGPESVGSPGTADGALTVAATDAQDAIAYFSSRGPRVRDKALKPDVSAPGVRSVSARAAGTSMGAPVDDLYTAASGTSMAAPQVAGAAAVLVQKHPEWTPEQVKAALASTADPVAGVSPHDQGAGRIDVAEALSATVLAEDEDADLGFLRYPQTGVSTYASGWRNDGDTAVTLELTLDIRDKAGNSLPADTAWLSAPSVVVPAGGMAQAIINVDARRTAPGQTYAGYLTARIDGSGEQLQIPVGFTDEAEAYDLVLRGVHRDGTPAAGETATAWNVDNQALYPLRTLRLGPDGVGRLRVPRGNYHVASGLLERRHRDPLQPGYEAGAEIDSLSVVTAPEVSVTADTTVVLDARPAVRTSATVEGVDTVPANTRISVSRTGADGRTTSTAWDILGEAPVYVTAGMPATKAGELTTTTGRRLTPRKAELRTTGPHARRLKVAPAQAWSMPEWSARELRPIDVGTGSQAEFDAVDVAAGLALARRDRPLLELAERAKLAGAAVLAVLNDRPGMFGAPTDASVPLPVIIVDGADAAALVAAARHRGKVVFTSDPHADVTFDLAEAATGNHVVARHYTRADVRNLARIDATYLHGTGFVEVGTLRHLSRPGKSTFIGGYDYIGHPSRVEYVTPGYALKTYTSGRLPGRTQTLILSELQPALEPAENVSTQWFGAPLHTSLGLSDLPAHRNGDALGVSMSHLTDGYGHRGEFVAMDGAGSATGSVELHRNGSLVGTQPVAGGSWAVPPEPARYRLVSNFHTNTLSALSTRSTSTWEFDSTRPADGKPEVLPLPEIDYDFGLDDAGRLADRDLTVNVRPQSWPRHCCLDPLPDSVFAAERIQLWYSIDDGATWRGLQPAANGNSATVRLPALGRDVVVSVRAEVTTKANVKHSKTVVRAVRAR